VTLVVGVVALVAGCLAGWYGRYFVIEPAALHAVCGAAARPEWCAARDDFIAFTFTGTPGIAAVALAAAGWVLRGRLAAACVVAALLVGGATLVLYDTAWAATAVLAALLRAVRVPPKAAAEVGHPWQGDQR
jgi:hypothetical protein